MSHRIDISDVNSEEPTVVYFRGKLNQQRRDAIRVKLVRFVAGEKPGEERAVVTQDEEQHDNAT